MAMRLHFKNGAIIRFILTCNVELSACGKVVKVNDDEVVFIPQKYVSKEEYDKKWGTDKLDSKVSVDMSQEIHLDRSIIAMWMFEGVPLVKNAIYYEALCPSEIDKIVVNHYDEDGYCKGNGEYFE